MAMDGSMWPHIATILLLLRTVNACDTEEDIRLVNGRNEFEGRVEVCQNSMWKTVCYDDWGNEEAAVVCRQLGRFNESLPNSTLAVPETNISVFGRGTGPGRIIRVKWSCAGTERNLLQCQMNKISCSHNRYAGVYCYDNCIEEEIRVVTVDDYPDGGKGRVEVCLNRYWGTVCDDGWDSNDATTVCRQLGYSNLTRGIPTRRAYFGEGSGPIHLSRAQCKSVNIRLIDCDIDRTGMNGCNHSEDAGVVCIGGFNCSDGDVRLVGGENEREGRVEICYNGVWGTVCDRGWDEVDANVVCSQLGYGKSARVLTSFGTGEGPILLDNVTCNTSHSELSQCVHPEEIGLHNCDRNNTAGVICPEVANNPSTISPATTTTSLVLTAKTSPLSAILGTVGGALVVGIIAAVVIALIIVVTKRRKVQKGSMDNPTYDEAIRIDHLEIPTIAADDKMNHQNTLYSEIGPKPEKLDCDAYQGLFANTMIDEVLYESIRCSSSPGALENEEEDGNESEVVYDVPPIDDDYDEVCYSIQEPMNASYSEC